MMQFNVGTCERFRVYAGCFILGLINMILVGPMFNFVSPALHNMMDLIGGRVYHFLYLLSSPDYVASSLPTLIGFLLTTGVPFFFLLFLWPTPRKLLRQSKMFLLYAWLAYSSSVLVFYAMFFVFTSLFFTVTSS